MIELVFLALVGLVVGAFARLALPGRDPMGLLATMLIGLAGAFVGGLIGAVLLGGRAPGLLLAIACSAVIVYFVRRARGGSLTEPGRPRHVR